ncbi:MAG: zinc ribbon domain-containing protein [Anaerolineae bacterium]
MNTTPKFCSNCGHPLRAGARFCGQCGAPVDTATEPEPQDVPSASNPAPARPPFLPPQPPAQPSPPQPAPTEPIVSITPSVQRRKGFLGMGYETFSLVLTPTRMIFAALDKQRMAALVNEARTEAKAEGKGFFGQWGAQLRWLDLLVRQLRAMTPEQILAQRPGSFAIPNSSISRVRVRRREVNAGDGDSRTQITLIIDTAGDKHKFEVPATMSISARDLKQRLQQTLGSVVR